MWHAAQNNPDFDWYQTMYLYYSDNINGQNGNNTTLTLNIVGYNSNSVDSNGYPNDTSSTFITANIPGNKEYDEFGDRFYHIAIVRESNTYSLFFDGDRIGQDSLAQSLAFAYDNPYDPDTQTSDYQNWPWNKHAFNLGALSLGTSNYPFEMWVDDFRLSSKALYSGSTYTVPTSELT